MSTADASGLFYEGDLGKSAPIEFSGSRQPRDTGSNDADFMVWGSRPGDAIVLFDQRSIVKTQVWRIREAGRPLAFGRALWTNNILGCV